MRWWRKRPSPDKLKAARRAAALKEPKRRWRGTFLDSPFLRFTRPAWRRRLFVGGSWLGGWALLSWALSDWLGPAGWKVGAGLLLVGWGGLGPLVRVVAGGLSEYPPWDWFSAGDDSE